MTAYRFENVRIDGYGTFFSDQLLTSSEIEDRIAPLYKKLGLPFGTLERVSGISTRRVWGRDMAPSTAGAHAARQALERAGVDPKEIGALISCSVCRDLFEPATACIMHKKLGMGHNTLAFDVTNACIGFSNGLMIVANMIESGQIEKALVVSGENPAIIIDSNFALCEKEADTMTRERLLKVLPTFTLGGGAAAFVLSHASVSNDGHKFLGGAACTASEHAELCSGNGDFCVMKDEDTAPVMETESNVLISAAAKLGGEAWSRCSERIGWSSDEIDHVICHQVGKQVNDSFYREMGLPFEKDFAIYKDYGNMISAALPSAVIMASEARNFKKGDKVVTTAFGSGLNAVFSAIEW